MKVVSKKQLRQVLKEERQLYLSKSTKKHLIYLFEKPLSYKIWKWQKVLRICEYWQSQKGTIAHLFLHYYKRRLFNRGTKLNIEIYPGCFEKGLKIYHTGIIVNSHAQIGENCQLHGQNCIGNNGNNDICPRIGNGLNLGIGACIIGDVQLGHDSVIGAGSIVNKSFPDKSVIIGVPGKLLNKNDKL